jgi:hypothetical protein
VQERSLLGEELSNLGKVQSQIGEKRSPFVQERSLLGEELSNLGKVQSQIGEKRSLFGIGYLENTSNYKNYVENFKTLLPRRTRRRGKENSSSVPLRVLPW